MSRYAGTTDLINYMGLRGTAGTIGTAQLSLLQSTLDWAERQIDNRTRRNFAGTAGTVRYNRMWVDHIRDQAFYLDRDLHTLVSLTNGNGQVIPVGSVWLEPQAQEPPYRVIRLHSSYVYSWNTDQDMVIAGTWGFSTVAPDDIIEATIRLAAYAFRLKDVGVADVTGFNEAGEVTYPKGIPDDVKIILEPYRSRSGGFI